MITLNPQQKQLIVATAAIWGISFLIALAKFIARSSNAMDITIVTKPPVVKIKVNERFLQNGRYLLTPQVVTLKPGKNELKLMREGYQTHTSILDKSEDEKLSVGPITLNPKPLFETIAVEITGDRITNPYHIELNKGFFQGDTPLVGTDLPLRGSHTLEIYPDGVKGTTKLKCSFTLIEPGAKPDANLDRVKIKIIRRPDGTFHTLGCQLDKDKPSR